MFRVSPFLASLVLSQIAPGGALITLDPDPPLTPEGYEPGQVVRVEVLAQLTTGTPSVQPSGIGSQPNQIRVRFFNLDLTDSDPALEISPVINHPCVECSFMGFWNFSSSIACTNDASACGNGYFVDDDLDTSTPNVLNIAWTNLMTSASGMIRLNQSRQTLVGSLDVKLPYLAGSFVLDVLNADEDLGAEIRHGFGVAADPTDPASPLRANTGEITGGRLDFLVGVPEPATLTLLGLGGLAAAFRRRRN